jgi:uridine phosphorylase
MDETVQKHLDKANSAWPELVVTFGGPRRRTMICRMLQYLVVTAALFYYSSNIASTSIRTLLGGPF